MTAAAAARAKARAHAPSFTLGPRVVDEQQPLMARWDLAAVLRGVPHWIGTLIHRDYESGYPKRWEVMRGGGTTWDFYDTEAEAHAGAEEYAAQFIAAVRRSPGGVVNMATLRPPTPAHRQQGTAPEVRAALVSERAVAALNLRKILGRCGSEGELRTQLERYAATLAGEDSQ